MKKLLALLLLFPLFAFGQRIPSYDTNRLSMTPSNLFDFNITNGPFIQKTKGQYGQLTLTLSNFSGDGLLITRSNGVLIVGKIGLTNATLYDVKSIGQTNRQFFAWDAAGGYWTNVNNVGAFAQLGNSLGFSPADSTTYYFSIGFHGSSSTAYNDSRMKIREGCRIKGIDVKVRVAGTLGSGETVSHYIRINDTTDVGQIDLTYAAASQDGSILLDQVLAAGDYIAGKVVCPAWATNPTTVMIAWIIYVEELP
jgi:hypothetical protein